MPFALRTAVLVVATTALCTPALPAAATPTTTFRERVVSICEDANDTIERDLEGFAREHPTFSPAPSTDPAQRALNATWVETMTTTRTRANRRLARVTAPEALRARYARFVRLERRTNSTLPTRLVGLLRQPDSAQNRTALARITEQGQGASARFQRAAAQLRLGRCDG